MKARLVLIVMVLAFILTIYAWFNAVGLAASGVENLRNIGLLLAAAGLLLIFFQFVFAARIKSIEAGFGLDRMLRWHRFIGRAGLAAVTMHVILIAGYRLTAFGALYPNLFIWIGLAALIGFMITAALASLHRKIGIVYETWRNIHLLNYILFPLALVHVFYFTRSGAALYYLWLALAVLFASVIAYRIVKIWSIKSNPYAVTEIRQETADIWSICFKGKAFNYKPGQFMILQLLRDGKLSSPHPFTISSSPSSQNLSVTPKEVGDFTSSVKNTRVGDQAYIDAPYGVFSFVNYPFGEPVFIAGGIGITPFISMLRYIKDQNIDRKTVLFWVNRSEHNLCFRDELEAMEKEMPAFKVILTMTGQPDWPGEKGRLSGDMIRKHLDTLEGKEFFVCGPPEMTASVIAELRALGIAPSRLHSELFQL